MVAVRCRQKELAHAEHSPNGRDIYTGYIPVNLVATPNSTKDANRMRDTALRYVFHIGPHKTGSTYIQKILYDNKEFLGDCRIHYPMHAIGPQFGHHKLVEQIKKRDREAVSEFFRLVTDEDSDVTIVSSENFDALDREDLALLHEFVEDENLTFIYFKRNSTDLLYSFWQELVKHGSTESFFEYALKHLTFPYLSRLLNHRLVLDSYADEFGDASVIVADYDIATNDATLFETFCGLLDLNEVATVSSKDKINRSMSAIDAEILRALNIATDLPPNEWRAHALWYLRNPEKMKEVVKSTGVKSLIDQSVIRFNVKNSIIDEIMNDHFKQRFAIANTSENAPWNPEDKLVIRSDWMMTKQGHQAVEEIYLHLISSFTSSGPNS